MLKEAGITALTKAHNYDYLYKSINEVIHSYASQAVRMALEEAAEKAQAYSGVLEDDDGCGIPEVSKGSILSLESSILSRLK